MGGYASTDNGFARFDHVRIPKENMLSGFAQVTDDGRYLRPPHKKMSYGGVSGCSFSFGLKFIGFADVIHSFKVFHTMKFGLSPLMSFFQDGSFWRMGHRSRLSLSSVIHNRPDKFLNASCDHFNSLWNCKTTGRNWT